MPSLGEISQFIVALVAAYGAIAAERARRQSKVNGTIIAKVQHETNSMRSQLETAAQARGNLEGHAEQIGETAAALVIDKQIARDDAARDAENAAQIRISDKKGT